MASQLPANAGLRVFGLRVSGLGLPKQHHPKEGHTPLCSLGGWSDCHSAANMVSYGDARDIEDWLSVGVHSNPQTGKVLNVSFNAKPAKPYTRCGVDICLVFGGVGHSFVRPLRFVPGIYRRRFWASSVTRRLPASCRFRVLDTPEEEPSPKRKPRS